MKDYRSEVAKVLEEAESVGRGVAENAAIASSRSLALARVLDALADYGGWSVESLEDVEDDLTTAGLWFAEDLPCQVREALSSVDELVEAARDLAEYVDQLVGALEGTFGLGEDDQRARRIARDVLRAVPLGGAP